MRTRKKAQAMAAKSPKTSKKTTAALMKEEVFYYERRQIIILTLIYAVIAILVWKLTDIIQYSPLVSHPAFVTLMIIVMILSLSALGSVVYVLNFPQTLAVLTKEGIKIDHNELLKWGDIACVEERETSSAFHRSILALITKPNCKYCLTFMQRLCRYNVFTPFSIPLYAMSPNDAEKIKQLIKQHVKKYKPLKS